MELNCSLIRTASIRRKEIQQPAVAPDGSVYSNMFNAIGVGIFLGKFDNSGNLLWRIFDQFVQSTNIVSSPDVGPDGRIYDGRNLSSLYAINSNGTVQWQYLDSGILFGPVVSPLNDLLMIGGIVTYGQPGFFEAVSTSGVSLWKQLLPVENGLNIVPMSRARFTPDGQTAYFGTSVPGQNGVGYSYLYSVQTGSSSTVTLSSLTLSPTTVVGGGTSKGTVTLSGPAPSGGAVVSLTSSKTAVARVPASVTVAAGQSTASFTVTTYAVTTATSVTLTASYSGNKVSATLTVNPPALSAVTLSPSTVKGGSTSNGTVVLNGPAPTGGVVVSLSSNNTALVTVPSSITVAAGSRSAKFTAQTKPTLTRTVVTIYSFERSYSKES